ncbi:class I SAM-dependent methyltransferase [Ancylobacter rudongensis]|uniref:Predicted nicotinamide N-methyase n=1 Tax=Ancylobacter rudongensis TaxID=177413 RepID=A0A1G4U2D6_9HYPH|nr:50S ribosomal protein L11 methyltransferase [Ancylobacter rudongensis]SCW87105.1 Predicted nicotinamide N-methyase [Ancylobacter rudongensis]
MTPRGIADPDSFIRTETARLAPPLVPEITLHLATESLPIWQRTEEELGEIGLPPPFWAFAWAGGQALARYILDHPETVRGKRVLDFASGSGLVGIAAAKAGAAHVACADIDPFAHAAIALNAALNKADAVTVLTTDVVGTAGSWDVVLAGDIAYERDLAARVFAWLQALSARGADVWIGDPGRSYLPRDRLEKVADYAVPVSRELEDSEIKATSVWRPRR